MPSKQECAKKFPKGSNAYKKCVSYQGQNVKEQQPKKPQGGSYGG